VDLPDVSIGDSYDDIRSASLSPALEPLVEEKGNENQPNDDYGIPATIRSTGFISHYDEPLPPDPDGTDDLFRMIYFHNSAQLLR